VRETVPDFLRRYLYGFVLLALEVTGAVPSQHVRRWLFTGVFGLRMGTNSYIFRRCRFRAPWKIRIGSGTVIGSGVELDGRGCIEIGSNVNISSEVMLWTAQHDHRDPQFSGVLGKVTLEDYVWLGPRVIVLPGVTVARGCVVGAGAVVTKSTEPYGIYAGVPCRRIGERAHDLVYVVGSDYTPFI
jgi:acetyltransferase-like isoleucine patch superfamily enzyme